MSNDYVQGEKIPVAISTSEALEGLEDRNVSLFICMETFVRNTYDCLEDKAKVDLLKLKESIVEDMSIVKELFPKCRFYTSPTHEISKIDSIYLRKASTDKQKSRQKAIFSVTETGLRESTGLHRRPYRDVKGALILTHAPCDLLGHDSTQRLLESHTGSIKKPVDYYTKLYKIPKASIERIPLTLPTLMIFGDHHNFRPMKLAIRKRVLALAVAKKWNYTTNEMRVSKELQSDKDLRGIYKPLRKEMENIRKLMK